MNTSAGIPKPLAARDTRSDRAAPDPEPALSGADTFDLSGLIRTLWVGKFWVVIAGFLGLTWGFYQAYIVATPVYSATATVAFESRAEQVVDFESVLSGLPGDLYQLNTEIEVLRSRALVEQLVREMDLIEDPEFNSMLRDPPQFSYLTLRRAILDVIRPPLPEGPPPTEEQLVRNAVDAALWRIQVSNLRQSLVFLITVTTESPTKSAEMANKLAEIYIRSQIQSKIDATEEASKWLAERVTELRFELEAAQKKVQDFSTSSELISTEALVAQNFQVKELRDRLRSLQREGAQAEARLALLRSAESAGDLAQQAAAADDLVLNRVSEGAIAGDERALASFNIRFQAVLERAEQDVQRFTTQSSGIRGSIQALETQIVQQSEDAVLLAQLQQEAEAINLLYESFLSRLKETSIQAGLQRADSTLLSAATVPWSPSAPRKMRIMALWLMVGLVVGAAIALQRERQRNTFRTADDLEAITGYPVLGEVPKISVRNRTDFSNYLHTNPTSQLAESIRNLRTSLLLSNVDRPPQVIMSTSALPGEGKTTMSISVAMNLAALGKKVLLVECDIRRRVIEKYVGTKAQHTFIDVMSNKATMDEAIIQTPKLGCDVLLGQRANVNAADLFSSDSFAKLVGTARESYDFVVLDTPPTLLVTDARVIGRLADAILVAVKWDSTPRTKVVEALRSLDRVNLRATGLVLNQINGRVLRKYGYKGYDNAAYGRGYYDA